MDRWDRATLDGLELEYSVRGSGAPVVLVHAGVFADWFGPLLEEPALIDRHQLITYRRVGYAGQTRPRPWLQIDAGSVAKAVVVRLLPTDPSRS